MCGASYPRAELKKASTGSTSITDPSEASLKPSGWFIQELTATTDTAPPRPAITIGTPVQKWAHPESRFQPKM